jgi:ParB-like chromosome segregation protein Spo0J
MKKINILNIRIDGGTQPRQEINYDVVKDYAELMRDGVTFPPVTVYFDGAEYWLADGFHRYHATKANATATIEAEVVTGSVDDAEEYSFTANGGRGNDLTKEDKKAIIRRMLLKERYAGWSQERIAKHVHVSAMFVSRVKASMEIKDEPKTKKFIKDGVEKEMNVSNIGKQAKEQPAKKPEVEPYDENEDKIRELSDVITQLDEQVTLLKDKIAIGQWDASEIEKIDVEETLADLRERIRLLEIDNKALRESRDMFQNRNAELMKTVTYLQRKLKKETA